MNFDNIWIWVVCVVGVLTLLPYFLGPFLLKFSLIQPGTAEVVLFPIDHPDLPRQVREHFERVQEQLGRVGFQPVAGLALPRQLKNVKAVLVLFENQTTKDSAIASVIYADLLDPPLQTAYTEIVSRFRDGTLIQTNNSAELSAFPAKSGVTTTQLPAVDLADRLYRLHRALVQRAGAGEQIMRLHEEFHGDPVAYLIAAMREELDAQIETGYMAYREERDQFIPTWKGAICMCWGQLFPWKNIRILKRNRRQQALLDELAAADR